MDKVKEALLNEYKKANKTRKIALATKYGYTQAEYEKYLGIKKTTIKATAKPKEKVTVHCVTILDASGSMSNGKYTTSQKGIVAEWADLRNDKNVNWTYSLVEFVQKNNIKTHILLGDIPKLDNIKWEGAKGGDTPLYKTVYDTIKDIKSRIKSTDKVLVKVYTDGQNNTEESYTKKCAELIKEVQEENFTVTFVATEQDLRTITRAINVDESNTFAITNDVQGFEKGFAQSRGATMSYSANVADGKDVLKGFYKQKTTL